MKNTVLLIACLMTSLLFSQEKENCHKDNNHSNCNSSDRPDGHAPIGVMGDHTHPKGGFMISYKYMTMGMQQLKEGRDNATNANGFTDYMVTPQNMIMNMHMLGAMYAPTDKITIMAMANYIENDMNLQMMMMGMTRNFSTKSSGLGDVSLSALYSIFNSNKKNLHAQVGVSIPTGSIEAKDATPMSMGEDIQLPYPMQLGTGSWGTKLGLTYQWHGTTSSFGAQLNSHINLNDNDQDFRFGNHYQATTWVAAKANDWLSASFRLNGQLVDEIKGKSDMVNPMMVSTADTTNSGGLYIHYGFGVNLLQPKGTLKGLRFGAEILLPLYQDVNGFQLDQSYTANLGVQYAFH